MDAISKGLSVLDDTTRVISRIDNTAKDFSISDSSRGMIVFLVGLLIAIFIIHMAVSNVQLWSAKKSAMKNPTQHNAWKIYKILGRLGIGINNHPKIWGEYRNLFIKINNSPNVPSETKLKLKERLEKKGLYINNVKIIDNYKDPYVKVSDTSSNP